jgi:GNAT superfamily N-acetyltransferase
VITVRPATEADVAAMSAVLTASITELCTADHRGDPATVRRWTANKTPEGVRAMLANQSARMFVAERDGAVVAVGSILAGAEIGLNYVLPAQRFSGISRALLEHMEAAMRAAGASEAHLTSTVTAHRFYRDAGWEDDGPPQDHGGLTCQPMRKRL